MVRYIKLLLFIGLAWGQDYSNLKNTKVRVAVFEITDNTRSVTNIDEIVQEMMITELVKSEIYKVIDRQEISTLMEEKKFQYSGAITEQTAVTLGKMLGIKLGIFCTINQFDIKAVQKEDLLSLGVRGMTDNKYKLEHTKSTATFEIDLKIIDIKTGEIVLAEKAKSKSDVKNYDGKKFDKNVITNSARKIVSTLVKKIEKYSERIPWEARVTNIIDNNQIVINSGYTNGVELGMVFDIFSVGEEIIDPSTGILLGSTEYNNGRLKIIRNDIGNGKASLCEISVKKDPISINDLIKIPLDIIKPIYRFYHKKNKDHFYTKDSNPKGDWKAQGIEFYAYPSQNEGTVPIYRFYHKKNKDHFYTKNSNPKGDWKAQGIEFYALPSN